MTFREEALIRAWSSPRLLNMNDGHGVDRNRIMAEDVQRLADAACEVWGHELDSDLECFRCGKRQP